MTRKSRREKELEEKNKGGRPPLISDEIRQRLVQMLRAFVPLDTAVCAVGIDRKSLRAWLKRGARAERAGATEDDRKEGAYVKFLVDIRKAMAEAESIHVVNIGSVARGKPGQTVRKERELPDGSKEVTITKEGAQYPQWTASAWLLERRKPERYARRETVAHEGGKVDRPIIFEMKFDRELPPEQEDDGGHREGNGNGNGSG